LRKVTAETIIGEKEPSWRNHLNLRRREDTTPKPTPQVPQNNKELKDGFRVRGNRKFFLGGRKGGGGVE